MARGNRRQAIFRDDEDRRSYLRALGTACERTGWGVYAWVLMDNHFISSLKPRSQQEGAHSIDVIQSLYHDYFFQFKTGCKAYAAEADCLKKAMEKCPATKEGQEDYEDLKTKLKSKDELKKSYCDIASRH